MLRPGLIKYIYSLRTANNLFYNHLTPRYFATKLTSFDEAKSAINTMKNEPNNMTKLKIYALFKQSTVGDNNTSKPGMMDFVGKAKWDAWTSVKSKTKEQAETEYISIIQELVDAESDTTETEPSDQTVEGLSITTNSTGVRTILLNRPQKKNAITWKMYGHWAEALRSAAKDTSVKVVVVTGAGDFFCSGNDLSNFTSAAASGDIKAMAQSGKEVLLDFVGSFIDFPKPLIALVNGPAVGIPVTTMAMYDYIIAADHVTFHTPFTNLGQTPEGCSSYTFPRIMGTMKANQMLLFNQKITASEAKDVGFVSEIIPKAEFSAKAAKRVEEIAALPPQTLQYGKELCRSRERKLLHEVNRTECERLAERWTSDECINAITKFFQRKN